jgi:purine-binding chemotaxis protein CheW
MENQIVVFELGAEFFGVDISTVESIIKMQAITKMPHSPRFVEGVTNLRGKVLPVIDARKRFGMPAQEPDRKSRIIIISVDRREVGLIVDGVSEVLTINEQTIEQAPPLATTVESAFITGIAKINDRLVILLDPAQVLTDQEQESLAEFTASVV